MPGISWSGRIPIEAGLGGGSSDAAVVLRALNVEWGLSWPYERLLEVGATVGSDVPLFLAGRQCVLRGRGDRVEPVDPPWRGWVVVIVPTFGLATARVYHALRQDEIGLEHPDPRGFRGLPAAVLMERLFNDLEAPAFRIEPRLADLRLRLEGGGGRTVRMTGSGSALFTLFDEQREAVEWQQGAAVTGGASFRTIVCSTWMGESGPN
jgi:4-diphosphocytidyl-2-C-methyl-D-erythritol kinase